MHVLLRCEFFDSILRVFRGGNKDASAVQEGALAQGQDTVLAKFRQARSGAVGAVVAEAQLDYDGWRRRYERFLLRSFGADSGGVTDYKILGLPPMFSAIRFISEAISMLDRRVAKRHGVAERRCWLIIRFLFLIRFRIRFTRGLIFCRRGLLMLVLGMAIF